MWYNTFDSIFFITGLTIITGSIGLCLKFCLKSKCDNVNLCYGLIKIHRNVELEMEDIEENKNEEIQL
jgi:hypothetical protein